MVASPLMLEARYRPYPRALAHFPTLIPQPAPAPAQLDDTVGQQIVGVPHRAPAQDVGRVQSHLHAAPLQVALRRRLDSNTSRTLSDQLGPEHLERAFGEGPVLHLNPQSHLPGMSKSARALASASLTLSWVCNSSAVASRLGGTLSRPLSAQ